MASGRIKSVCLFCGSSDSTDPSYLEAAAGFGRLLAREGVRLVYGGGGIGLMGAAAKACNGAGGKVLGIMPEFLRTREALYDSVKTVVVHSMHDRKAMMFAESDAFVVMPGGIGTLEEAVELLSWRRLDLHRKPIAFVDLDGFWQPYFTLMRHTVEKGLTPAWLPDCYAVVERIEDILPALSAPPRVNV